MNPIYFIALREMANIGFSDSGAVEEIGSNIMYRYTNMDFIGRGTFGTVYKARIISADSDTYTESDFVALKVMQIGINSVIIADQRSWMTAVRRLRQLTELTHEHLVAYHKVSITKAAGGVIVELAMDYHEGGDLASFLKEAKKDEKLLNNWGKVIRFAKEIARGVEFLHRNGFIHGDLKPANILLHILHSGTEWLVIGDLDDLVQMEESATCSADFTHLRGTTRYMSPEMLRKFSQSGTEPPGRKTDTWSLGCIILDMAETWKRVTTRRLIKNGKIVNAGVELTGYAVQIIDGYVPFVSGEFGELFSSIIRQCLRINTASRLSVKELLRKLQSNVIVFLACRGFEFRSFLIYDPLADSVHVQQVPHAPEFSGLPCFDYRQLSVNGTKILFKEQMRENRSGVPKAKFHLWNVNEETWCQYEPINSLNMHPATSLVAVDDKVYFWDRDEIFREIDISTYLTGVPYRESVASAENPNVPFSSFLLPAQAVARSGQQIFYATIRSLYQYDTVTKEWKFQSNMPHPCLDFAMAVVDRCVYIIGGRVQERSDHFATTACVRLNLDTGAWEKIKPLRQPRLNHAACVILDRIYVCGGRYTEKEHALDLEMYDTKRVCDAEWSTVTLSPNDANVLSNWATERNESWQRITALSVNLDDDTLPLNS
ncbi:uncharacterized protein LOC129590655 [Paramacrobiotus metropolitanus]|uniref:uncharacterized protein LOC129590655 n=1 Tax=Paramacrobiotus metropolitanus TaxID=2943436 RepID=UPI0024464D24|nr:uncharacterized protein LOC129590655 [Paramacrobiotus metropolitanus]